MLAQDRSGRSACSFPYCAPGDGKRIHAWHNRNRDEEPGPYRHGDTTSQGYVANVRTVEVLKRKQILSTQETRTTFYHPQKHRDSPDLKPCSIVFYELCSPWTSTYLSDPACRRGQYNDGMCCSCCIGAFISPFLFAVCVTCMPLRCACLPCTYAHAKNLAATANNPENQTVKFFQGAAPDRSRVGYAKGEGECDCCYWLFASNRCVSYWNAVETGYLMQGLDDILITNQTGNAMLWLEDVVGKNTSDSRYPAAARRRME